MYITGIKNKVEKITKGKIAKQNWRYYADLTKEICNEYAFFYTCLDTKMTQECCHIRRRLESWLNNNLSEDDMVAYYQYLD